MLPVLPIENYGVARVAHREVWCCLCCPIEKYGLVHIDIHKYGVAIVDHT